MYTRNSPNLLVVRKYSTNGRSHNLEQNNITRAKATGARGGKKGAGEILLNR